VGLNRLHGFFRRDHALHERAGNLRGNLLSLEHSAEIAEKTAAYLAAGAVEVWIVKEDGSIRYFTASGEQAKSGFPVAVSLPPPIR
jgi:hypothetical protein